MPTIKKHNTEHESRATADRRGSKSLSETARIEMHQSELYLHHTWLHRETNEETYSSFYSIIYNYTVLIPLRIHNYIFSISFTPSYNYHFIIIYLIDCFYFFRFFITLSVQWWL